MKKILILFFAIALFTGCAATEEKVTYETVFYPPLPQKPRIQFLTFISSEEDVGKKQSAFEEFLVGELPPLKRIKRPYDIVTVKNKMYIMDRGFKKLLVVDLKNRSFDYLKGRSADFQEPAGIWVTDDEYKYVTDFKRKVVLVFDDKDNMIRTYGKKGDLEKPLDVAVYENMVYVCDFDLHRIVVFDKDSGDVIRTIGEQGKKEGELFKPSHIVLDDQGNLFVNDAFNFRIQEFDPAGNFVRVIGYHGDTIGGFARPKGIAVDNEDHLYAVDTAFENVQIFDIETGKVLLFFGEYGSKPGDMYMPSAIFINDKNLDYFQKYADKDFRLKYLIYVGNSYGTKKINVYGFGEWTGESMSGAE